MKKLVKKQDITGWRNPTDTDKKVMGAIKNKLHKSIVSEITTLIAITVLIGIIDTIVIIGDFSGYFLLIPVTIVLIILCFVHYTRRLLRTYKILKNLKSGRYTIEDCYINYVEDTKEDRAYGNKYYKQAYIHNELNEYCTEPIIIDEEIEQSIKFGLDSRFILVNIGNKIYKLFKASDN